VSLAEQTTDIYLAPQLAPEPTLSAAASVDLPSFAGSYRDADTHSVLRVTASKDGLEAFGAHFQARDSGHFTGPDETEMTFDRQPNGVMRLTLVYKDTAPQILETYKTVSVSGQDLAQFVGEYTSAELEATYRLFVKEGKLMLAVNWQDPFLLEPTVPDEFQGPYGTAIVFRRDSAGRITGFDVFAGRVRNIAFVKTSR